MRALMITLTTSLTVAAPLAAGAFTAQNRIAVSGSADRIEVAGGGGFGARGAWCAAADYAQKRLGASGTTRLYVAESNTLRAGSPLLFTLNADGLSPRPVTIVGASLRTPGATLSVAHAQSFCADARVINR